MPRTIGEQKIETQQIYKLLVALKDGETLSYGTIRDKVGVDPQESKGRGYLATAIRNAEKETGATFACVAKEGTKRLLPDDTPGEYSRHRESVCRKSRRQFRRSAHVNYEAMSQQARDKLNQERTVLYFIGEVGAQKRLTKVADAVAKAGDSMTFSKTLELFQIQK